MAFLAAAVAVRRGIAGFAAGWRCGTGAAGRAPCAPRWGSPELSGCAVNPPPAVLPARKPPRMNSLAPRMRIIFLREQGLFYL